MRVTACNSMPDTKSSPTTAGKMKKNRIKTLAGDRVTMNVALRPEKGRLIFRHKDERRARRWSAARRAARGQFRRR